jgi:hypothetical protein
LKKPTTAFRGPVNEERGTDKELLYGQELVTAHLVLSLVPHKHDKRLMVQLDIVVDEDRYPWVQLLPHDSCDFTSLVILVVGAIKLR